MVCIYCGNKTTVTNSRKTVRLNTTWRRRKCTICQALFTSFEGIDLAQSIVVSRSDSPHAVSPFTRDRLFMSIYESCKHRPDALSEASALTDTIIGKIVALIPKQHARGVVVRDTIITESLAVLERFDTVAATYYRAYHKK